jgi:Haem-NO-binding
MYGMVNKAVVDLVCTRFGEATWEKIKAKAEVDIDVFVGMDAYPDEITYRLVGAASDVLGLRPEQVLEAFGQHWVLYTAREGYGAMLDAFGKNLREFLANLDAMHARIAITMPNLRPPSFSMTEIDAHTVRVDYFSTRKGLAPMVVGLLKGLGERFATPIEVTYGATGGDHDEFILRFLPV